jgi:hypothetical protein
MAKKDNKKVASTLTMLSMPPVANVTQTRFAEAFSTGKDWVCYGSDNKFPDFLYTLYLNSPTHGAIIDAKTMFTMGEGFACGEEQANFRGETFNEVGRKCTQDYHLFGGFAVQVIFNKAGKIAEIYWADFSKLRINKNATKAYWADDWSSYQTSPIEYDTFNLAMTNKTSQIFYYRGNSRTYYPIPSYYAGCTAIQTEMLIQDYHISNLKYGFTPNVVVNLNNGVPSDEEREAFEKKFREKFCSSTSAGQFLLSWNENKDNAITVEKLDDDNIDKKFLQLSKDTNESISIAHRLTSLTLLGRTPANTGFTKNEYLESYSIFQSTVIAPCQKEISRNFRKIMPDKDWSIKPFVVERNDE